jgi:site-specific recombinase XerD
VSPLRQALIDYLSIRRALGTKLERAEKLLAQFVTYLEARQVATVTIEDALAWATSPKGTSAWWWALRMSPVRGFATYLRTVDGCAEVPPVGLIAHGRHRATPYLYSDTDICALVKAAAGLTRRLSAATYPALIRVLAVTGMRIGEAIALDTDDLDDYLGVLTVREGKFGKSRLLPLHPSSTTGLRQYLQTRNRLRPNRTSDALFISSTGTRLSYIAVHRTFRHLTRQAGLDARSAACRPRIHDLRHSFAVATLLDWYRQDADVQALLPRLSTYLGHADPKHTFWYLSAAPELLTLAGQRLDAHLAGQP